MLLGRVKNSLRRRLWLHSALRMNRVRVNADPMDIRSDPNPKIVLIHVGKCAGETVKRTLLAKLPSSHRVYEMHCADANERIRICLDLDIERAHYVICTRDPVSRFVSAYNWDKHNLHASGRLAGKKYGGYFEEFSSVEYLVESLVATDAERRSRAQDFSRFGHMGMGQSWYTPLPVLALLPMDCTYLCDMSSLRDDLNRILIAIGGQTLAQDEDLANDKADYKLRYPKGYFSSDLSDRARDTLTDELREDYQVLAFLRKHFSGRASQNTGAEAPLA